MPHDFPCCPTPVIRTASLSAGPSATIMAGGNPAWRQLPSNGTSQRVALRRHRAHLADDSGTFWVSFRCRAAGKQARRDGAAGKGMNCRRSVVMIGAF